MELINSLDLKVQQTVAQFVGEVVSKRGLKIYDAFKEPLFSTLETASKVSADLAGSEDSKVDNPSSMDKGKIRATYEINMKIEACFRLLKSIYDRLQPSDATETINDKLMAMVYKTKTHASREIRSLG